MVVKLQRGMVDWYRQADSRIISNWFHLEDNFETSPQEFYTLVEAALNEADLPKVEISRVIHKEAGLFSGEREYLRVARERLVFDICASPYGAHFFFSWWLVKQHPKNLVFWLLSPILVPVFALIVFAGTLKATGPDCSGFIAALVVASLVFLGALALLQDAADELSEVPYLGYWVEVIFNTSSYHRKDSVSAFQQSIAGLVRAAVDEVRSDHGLRALGTGTSPGSSEAPASE